jgi:hypothetical protein
MSITILTAHQVKLTIPYGELQPIIEWCDRNCLSEWRYMEDPNANFLSGGWVFFFESERDYCAFLLWKKL